jgi:hypothetical protein
MTTYPGDDPQTPDDPQNPAAQPPEDDARTPEDPEGTEPTQPVGYWERRANEEAAERARAQGGQPGGQPSPTTPYPQSGPVFNPTTAQASPPSQPAQPAPPPQPAPGYGPGFQGGPNPYGQGPYGQAPYGQPTPPSYGGQPPGLPPAPGQPVPYAPMPAYGGFVAPPPDHPQSTLALVLGLVGVIGAFVLCAVPLLVSPFAWAVGHSALKEIRASQGRLGGESNARTGMILGIIGTVFLILIVLFIVFAIVMAIVVDSSTTTGTSA